jgi:hypothetical protein
MKTVKISVTYFAHGKAVTNTFKTQAKDPQSLFNNAIQDANVAAQIQGGQVSISRKVDKLHIQYLNMPDSQIINRIYLLK